MESDNLLSELLEEYKFTENKQMVLDEFIKLLWDSKYTLKKHKKYYSYEIDKEIFKDRHDLVSLFEQYKIIEFIFCKSYYKKRLDYIDYIRVHVNNMYAYLVDTTVYLPKEYYQLLLTPKKEYFNALNKLKNGEQVKFEDVKYKIEFALMEAEEIKSHALQNKINLKWPEYKKLINTYIERIFNNYIPPHEYENEHGWEMKVNVDGWNENNYIVKYFCKSLTGYLRNYAKNLNKVRTQKKCLNCGVDIDTTSNRQKYCDECNKIIKSKQKKEWRNMNNTLIKNDRVGETSKNTFGTKMEIVRYNKSNDIDVEFENGYIVRNTTYGNFIRGAIRNPYDRNHYGKGYIGEGIYKPTNNNINTKQYSVWKSMLNRCYSSKYQKREPSYQGCEVCDEWLNFQNFATWFDENYYEIDNLVICLDKDILVKGNKIYSPDNCVFVPKNINSIFIKSNATRGTLPIGVRYNKEEKRYYVYCGNGKNGNDFVGGYKNQLDAFNAYKNYKEKIIKQIANEYKEQIPKNLYDAMMMYEVEITD
jgi:hypothetical protein